MGAESQMIQFAKKDLNLKRRLLEQLEKSDTDFNQNITKVGRTMDTIFFFFSNWDSLHVRLNSHYEAWNYKKRRTKKITGYRKSI